MEDALGRVSISTVTLGDVMRQALRCRLIEHMIQANCLTNLRKHLVV